MRSRDINRRIERLGGQMVRQVGSHRRYLVTYVDQDGKKRKVATTVAQHPGDVPRGTVRAIEKDLEAAFGKGWLTG